MSPHRLILALSLAVLACAGFAAAQPWTVDPDAAARLIGGELSDLGLSLTAEGPATVRLLPLPRLDFARTRFTAGPGGPMLAEGGRLGIVLDPLGLVTGRVEIGSLALDGARIRVSGSAAEAGWSGLLQRLPERVRAGGLPHRLVLTRTALAGDGPWSELRDLDLDLSWPLWRTALEGQASLTWKGERARIVLRSLRPTALAAGAPSSFSAQVLWAGGSLSAEGRARLADGLHLDGEGRLQTASLPRAMAWLGQDAALLPLAEAFALEGSFQTTGRAVMLPRLRVTLGENVLDGAGSASFSGARPAVQATLASESLNLAPLLAGLTRLLDGAEAARTPVALGPLTGGDLDLRLSAAAGRIGPLQVEDIAASALVRADAIELALNRASLQGGTVKGRLTLASAGADRAETDLKLQGTLDRVDLGAVLADLGAERWVLGPGQGHVSLESTGRDAADLVAHLAGRAQIAIDRGTLVGLDLADVIQRHGGVAAGALARRNGRTPFERAGLSLRFAEGVGEIGDGALQAANLTATLRGRISLPERRFQARAALSPRSPSGAGSGAGSGPLFDLTGPFDAITARAARADGTDPDLPGAMAPDRDALPAALRAYAP